MIPESEFHKIIGAIITRTHKKGVRWTASGNETYRMDFKSSSFLVNYDPDPEHAMLTASVLNKKGSIVGSLEAGRYDPHYPILAELYIAARANALEIDETLDDIWTWLSE
jgi:hypothetical protein